MTDTSMADDNQIRNDFLAGQGGAADAQLQDWKKAMLAQAKSGTGAPPGTGGEVVNMLPIGKRLLTAVSNFVSGLVEGHARAEADLPAPMRIAEGAVRAVGGDVADLAKGLWEAGPGTVQKVYEGQLPAGAPETAEAARTTALSYGILHAPEGAMLRPRGSLPLEAAQKTTEQLVGEPAEPPAIEPRRPPAEAPEVAPPEPEAPAAPQAPIVAPEPVPAVAPEPAPLAERLRSALSLGDPLEPAVTVRPTPQTMAQAEVTLGRMEVPSEPPPVAAEEGRIMPARTEEVPPEPVRMSDETIHEYLAGARVDNPVKVNLARIGSGEDIADALAQVSKTIEPQAVQSNLATKAAADALGLQPEDFLAGYKGEQLNASQTTAMRFMLDSSARQLIDYAKAAREPMASPEAQGQFLKAFSVHRSLQQYFENARAEAGRTLQSWSIMSQERAGYTQAVDALIRRVDENGDLSQLADQVADMDDPLKVNRLVAGAMASTGRDRLLTWMYNARLSSPTTVVKKLASDVGMAMWNTATRYTAETLGSGAVAPGEAGALIQGYIGSFGDALRAGGQALKAGESQFWKDYGTMDAIDMPSYGANLDRINRRFRLSALANGADTEIALEEPTRGMYSYIRSALPTSWIGAADDFAKVWQYRANLRALAVRAADGDPDKFASLMDAPPSGLHQQALDAALKYTFQEPLTSMAASLRDVVDKVNIPMPGGWDIPVGRIVMPFVKVPANIARMAYRSSPLAYFLPSPAVRAIMAAGGAERDILIAQMGLGTALSLGVGGLVLNGNITGKGPSDAGLRREWQAAGNRPYSLELPGARPIQLNQIEPFGMTLGAIADTYNLFKFAKDEDNERLGLSLVFGVGQSLLSKNYMQGLSDFLDAVAHPDQDAESYTSRLIAGLAVPQLGQRLSEATDTWQRAHYGILDGIEANLPIVREGLPPARTLWGDPVPTREAYAPFMPGHAAEAISPIGLGPDPATAEPIDRWIWNNRAAFPREEQTQRGLAKPSRIVDYSNGKLNAQVELNPTEYDRYQVLAGNGLKDPRTGMGAKDTLNALVQGNYPGAVEQRQWNGASPAEQALIVRDVVTRFRNAAKQQLRADVDLPELESALRAGWQGRAAQLQGTPAR